MKKIIKATTILLILMVAYKGYSQKTIEFTKYKMCTLDQNNNDNNCKEKAGQVLYSNIKIVPKKYIELGLKSNIDKAEKIKNTWEQSKISLNNEGNLYLYKFLESEMRKEGDVMIIVLMDLEYNFYKLIAFYNQNNTTLVIHSD